MRELFLTRDDDCLATWKTLDGEIVCQWNDNSVIDYPEDVSSFRDVGDLVLQVWSKANSLNEQKLYETEATLREAVEVLKSIAFEDEPDADKPEYWMNPDLNKLPQTLAFDTFLAREFLAKIEGNTNNQLNDTK